MTTSASMNKKLFNTLVGKYLDAAKEASPTIAEPRIADPNRSSCTPTHATLADAVGTPFAVFLATDDDWLFDSRATREAIDAWSACKTAARQVGEDRALVAIDALANDPKMTPARRRKLDKSKPRR